MVHPPEAGAAETMTDEEARKILWPDPDPEADPGPDPAPAAVAAVPRGC